MCIRDRSNTIDINVDKSKKVDKNEKIIISCQIKRGVSGDNDNSTIVVIGDKVRVQRIDDFRGLICYIEKRKTHLGRKTRKDNNTCLLYTSPSPRDRTRSRMPSSA